MIFCITKESDKIAAFKKWDISSNRRKKVSSFYQTTLIFIYLSFKMCMYLILMKITIKTFHQILGVKYFIVHFKYAGQNMAKGEGFKYSARVAFSGWFWNTLDVLQLYAEKHKRWYRQKYGSSIAWNSSNNCYGWMEYSQATIIFPKGFPFKAYLKFIYLGTCSMHHRYVLLQVQGSVESS